MQKIVTSYATKRYYANLDLLADSAIEVGKADKFVKYTFDELKNSDYFISNKNIMLRPSNGDITDWGKIREAQYWIWKPYIILETMKDCDEGDVILYLDAGMIVIDNLKPLFEFTQIVTRMLFSASQRYGKHLHFEYTKRDCFILMGLDNPYFWNIRMINAAVSAWMKTPENISLLTEWQIYMSDSRIVTDDPNVCGQPDLPGFIQHRFDQSVLSLLCAKYSLEVYRDPSQYSINETDIYRNSSYGQLILQHNTHLFS